MAEILQSKIIASVTANEYRPCIVEIIQHLRSSGIQKRKTYKGLFHKWVTEAYVVGESPLRDGHKGGQICREVALVELEDGTMRKFEPESIRFIDTSDILDFKAYDWGEEEVKDGSQE